MIPTYQPSGRVRPGRTLLLFAVASVVVAGLAWLYQLGLYWIPFIYVSFLLTAGFAFAIVFVCSFIIRLGHVRNVVLGALLGLLLATVGLGAKYWFQYQALLSTAADELVASGEFPGLTREAARRMAASQISFMDHVAIRVEQGWNIGRRGKGLPVTGIFVYLVWLVEAAGVIGFVAFAAAGSAAEPYSETLGKWASEEEVVMQLPVTDPAMIATVKQAASVEQLLTLPLPKNAEHQTNQFIVYTVHSIEGEEMEDAYLTVSALTLTYDKEGKEEKKEEKLVEYAVLSSEQRFQLKENAEILEEAIREYRKAKLQAGSPDSSSGESSPRSLPAEDDQQP